MDLRHRLVAEHYFIDPMWRSEASATAYIEFRENEFVIPTRRNAERFKSISYSTIHSVVQIECSLAHCVIVGAERSLPVLLRDCDVVDTTSIERIASELKHRVSVGPAGLKGVALLERHERFFRRLVRPPWFVIGLTGFMVAVFCLVGLGSNANTTASETRFGSFIPALAASGEYYRLVTAGFLHKSMSHLITNCLALIAFGWIVEAAVGARRAALLLFFASTLGYCAWWNSGSLTSAAGSSAAIWGAFGATAVLTTYKRKDFPVGFRCLFILWAVIADQLRVASTSPAMVPHLIGGLSGILISSWWTRGSRALPLQDGPLLTRAVCAVALVVLTSGGMALRNSQLYGETRYFAAIHERLARPELADPEINLYSWHLALASDAPRDSLLLALESMDDLVERDFDPAYRDTLATLNYRLGNFPEAVQIARGIWDRAPKAWSASQLARFYEGWLNAGNIRGSDLPETISLETNQVESQLHYLSDDREVELRVALTESRSNSSNIHILLYKSDGLQGFVNVPLGAGKNYKSCRFDASNFGRIGTTARPVWVGHRESDTALPADACLLYWMTPMAKVMP